MGVTHSSQVRGRKRSELVVGERLDDAAAVVAGERDEQLVVSSSAKSRCAPEGHNAMQS